MVKKLQDTLLKSRSTPFLSLHKRIYQARRTKSQMFVPGLGKRLICQISYRLLLYFDVMMFLIRGVLFSSLVSFCHKRLMQSTFLNLFSGFSLS